MSDSELTTSILLSEVSLSYRSYASRNEALSLGRRRMVAIKALRGVSFELDHGDALGLVGHNGAGKSSLIQVIQGALVPTSGYVRVSAQPQRLSVAWALRPTLNGLQNIHLGLLAQGLKPAEARGLAAEVVEISELGDAINLPMATYSAGMRSRLGFAIATVRTPEILLLDEALAVGDKGFRRRSLERIREIRETAGTVVLATHDLTEVEESCNKAIWLNRGEVMAFGQPADVLGAYRRSNKMPLEENLERMRRQMRQRERAARAERAQRREVNESS